ncbi:10758_t:CDS:2 [Ambispora leptoticha]|uniref:Proteasome subunit beta n=1 Tax=Ambispora leptoticha TaxID=144679 RepID=A0A9N9CX49_9GLOM|nr:10758_t:CDS:2 [Ambispora leptoticha]
MNHFPNDWGKPQPKNHTQQPIITGSSVIAFKYKDGVMMAADNLVSFGRTSRYREIERLYPVGEYTVLGASGDISDFQHVKHMLDKIITKEYYTNDGHVLGAPHIYEYLSRVMYHRRSELNPLWNYFVVGGYHNGEGYLGYVDLFGNTYQSSSIATGFGMYLATPILRKAVEGNEHTLTEAQAVEITDQIMKVLFCRDAKATNKFQRAKITAQGVEISAPISVQPEWNYGKDIRGYS